MPTSTGSPFWRTTSSSSSRKNSETPAPEPARKVIGASYSHADILNLGNLYANSPPILVWRKVLTCSYEGPSQATLAHERPRRMRAPTRRPPEIHRPQAQDRPFPRPQRVAIPAATSQRRAMRGIPRRRTMRLARMKRRMSLGCPV